MDLQVGLHGHDRRQEMARQLVPSLEAREQGRKRLVTHEQAAATVLRIGDQGVRLLAKKVGRERKHHGAPEGGHQEVQGDERRQHEGQRPYP